MGTRVHILDQARGGLNWRTVKDSNTSWQELPNVGPAETYFILNIQQMLKRILGIPILDYS